MTDISTRGKKKSRQRFNTLLAEQQLTLLSTSALNGCAPNWTQPADGYKHCLARMLVLLYTAER